jgi:hypothetical protein
MPVSAAIERTELTPPEVAARWGVAPEKILAWIRSGELRVHFLPVLKQTYRLSYCFVISGEHVRMVPSAFTARKKLLAILAEVMSVPVRTFTR